MGSYLLRAPDVDLDRWQDAAREQGLPFSEWLRLAAERSAHREPDWLWCKGCREYTLPVQGHCGFCQSVLEPRPTKETG